MCSIFLSRRYIVFLYQIYFYELKSANSFKFISSRTWKCFILKLWLYIYYIYFLFARSRWGNLRIPKNKQIYTLKMDVNSKMGSIYFCYQLVTRSDSTVLTRTRLRWSDNLCPHRVVVITIVTWPKRACPSPLGLIFTGVQCRPWSNGTIVILTDPWRPILRCYYDFVQWLILWEHEESATGFEEII